MTPKRSSTTLSSYRQLSPDALQNLTIALGYGLDCNSEVETPYVKYILAQYPGKATLDDYVRLFVKVVEHFTGTSSPIPKLMLRLRYSQV
jgi:hypothetical protein